MRGSEKEEEEVCLQACWVAECGQLEEELMGMVSVGSGVTSESFSTLPLPAPWPCALWNSTSYSLSLGMHVCVCI